MNRSIVRGGRARCPHLRLQTWFPFQVEVCLNGREWLVRQLERARVNYQRQDNYVAWVPNVPLTGNSTFAGQVLTDLKVRPEGVRIKHKVGRNTLLTAINRGEWALNGLRNREWRVALYGEARTLKERQRQAGPNATIAPVISIPAPAPAPLRARAAASGRSAPG